MDITLQRVLPVPGSPAGGAAGAAGRLGADALVPGALGVGGTPGAGAPAADGLSESFAQLLAQALQDVNQLHHAADGDAARLAAGEAVDLHQVMIGLEKANVAFGLTVQVRNKLLEAYQEVMRMTI